MEIMTKEDEEKIAIKKILKYLRQIGALKGQEKNGLEIKSRSNLRCFL